MRLHPMHPACWVLHQLGDAGWRIHDLLSFTRASTLVLASRDDDAPVVLKAGFGSNHVLAELDADTRKAAYGFYWYAELSEAERALTREDFQHEIAMVKAAQGLDHVVPLLDEGGTDRFDWYTMPFYPEGNSRRLLAGAARDSVGTSAGLRLLADVAEGLADLHRRGIVHRDVYQENVLVHDGRGLITDLGAARRSDSPRGPRARGPEVHWPPEYATGYDRVTSAADVFSLAVLTYRFLCGDIPRHGHSHLDQTLPVLRPLLATALAQDPRRRPSMTDLRDGLRDAAALQLTDSTVRGR
ncbi:protein kinase [Streptomyces sp. MJP52]|uniref:protein kinase domain-containing protein n=1 Tax=Streptomyces sp. MJP52 TaxID=2940555 RepID=UPI002473C32D|nr:protein kinase [Streptomyces sp. MJP52]MDH6223670.1 serine/threonine protein kinase [Streptomyces sp. MJP52]